MPNRQLPRLLSGQMSKPLPFLTDFACERLCIVCIRESGVEQISVPVSCKMPRFAAKPEAWTGPALPGAFFTCRSGRDSRRRKDPWSGWQRFSGGRWPTFPAIEG